MHWSFQTGLDWLFSPDSKWLISPDANNALYPWCISFTEGWGSELKNTFTQQEPTSQKIYIKFFYILEKYSIVLHLKTHVSLTHMGSFFIEVVTIHLDYSGLLAPSLIALLVLIYSVLPAQPFL